LLDARQSPAMRKRPDAPSHDGEAKP
jgi:hypothetical protein